MRHADGVGDSSKCSASITLATFIIVLTCATERRRCNAFLRDLITELTFGASSNTTDGTSFGFRNTAESPYVERDTLKSRGAIFVCFTCWKTMFLCA